MDPERRRVMQHPDEQKQERLLILCVDRDNDIGRKAGVRTPLVGKVENVESAMKLILADPEESDANAMFEAIRIYDNLEKDATSRDAYQIATISGLELGGLAADRKLVSELADVLKRFQADGLIVVTDGFADEDIIPLVQSRVPVTSVRRVVVKHSDSIEETAAVFSRYMKMIVEDPRYSRLALGLPGVLLIALGILAFLAVFIQFDIYRWTWVVALIILGSYLLGRGYGIDRKISRALSRFYRYSVSDLVSGFSLIAGVLLVGVGFYQAGSYIASRPDLIPPSPIESSRWLALLPLIIGWLISKSLTMVVVGVSIVLLGRSIGYLLDRDSRFWRTSALVVICAWSWWIFDEISRIIIDPSLPPDVLIASIVIGIVVIAASGLATHFLGKRYQESFKEKIEEEAEGSRQKTGDSSGDRSVA